MFKLSERQIAVGRCLTFILCIIFSLVLLCNGNFIKTEVRDNISPVLFSSFFDISGGNVKSINNEFKDIINSHDDVIQLELYKFTPENNSTLYNGQINVATVSRDRESGYETSPFIPMLSSPDSIREILLNSVHHDTTETISKRCDDQFSAETKYTCSKYIKTGSQSKSIVSIPLVDNTGYHVIGYITIALNTEYSDEMVQSLVNSVRHSVIKIQDLMYKN